MGYNDNDVMILIYTDNSSLFSFLPFKIATEAFAGFLDYIIIHKLCFR